MSTKPNQWMCADWDSFYPQPVIDSTGKQIGRLMPRATQEQLGYGIQGWSRPTIETRQHVKGAQ